MATIKIMLHEFEIKTVFPVSPEKVYNAWLSSEEHTLMTGGEALVNHIVDDQFTAWDGYISGVNLELVPYSKIIQSWRTSEFKPHDSDSRIEIHFKSIESGCELTIVHSNIPEDQPDYKQGWISHYFEPMSAYFPQE